MTDHSDSATGQGPDEESQTDLVPFDFSAIRPSADRPRFDRTVSALAAEMTAARSAAGLGSSTGRAAATLIAWRWQVGLAAAVVMLVALSSLLHAPRARGGEVPLPPVAQAAGIPPRLAMWAQENYRPTPSDLIGAFSTHLTSPLYR